MRVLVLFTVMIGFLWQCKLRRADDSEGQSVRTADDALKIAVNYIGDTACMNYYKEKSSDTKEREANLAKAFEVIAHNKHKARQLVTHMLNGPNGELISEEYRASAPHRKHLLLSGDRFFDKMRSKNSPLDMQTIADNCRRLVLSVDSDHPPTIIFTKGFAIKNQQQELTKMAQGIFGELECLQDQPFCSFKCVANPNATCPTNKRYFTLVWPDQESKQVKALVHWEDRGKRDNSTITIPHLTYTGDAQAMWQRSSGRQPLPDTSNPSVPDPNNPFVPNKLQPNKPSVTQPAKPSVTQPNPTTPEPPTLPSKVFTAEGLATVSVAKAKRIAGSDEGEITLEFTALQDILSKWDGRGEIKVSSLNPYKFLEASVDVSTPSAIHPIKKTLYSGNKFFNISILDKLWKKGKKMTMKFRARLGVQGSASFKMEMSRAALFRQWKKFKDDTGNELITAVAK